MDYVPDTGEESSTAGSLTEQNAESASENNENNIPSSDTAELIVRFGDDGGHFTIEVHAAL